MNLSKYIESMKFLPDRFSNLAFWRGVRKLRDKMVDTFEYVGEWGNGIESEIDSLKGDLDNLYDIRNSSNILNITGVSSKDAGINVSYENDTLNISGAKVGNGIFWINTDVNLDTGTYVLSADGCLGVAHYSFTLLLCDKSNNVILKKYDIPESGLSFTVDNPVNVNTIRITYAVTDHIDYSGKIWINKEDRKDYEPVGVIKTSKVEIINAEIDSINNDISALNAEVFKPKKTKILISFDDAKNIYTDGRYDLVRKEYGFKFTYCVSVNEQNQIVAPPEADIDAMLFDGIDLALYSRYGWSQFTTADFNTTDIAMQEKFNEYVDNAVQKFEEFGYYNPTAWFCRQGVSGTALERALKRHHFKIVRGINPNHQYDETYGYIPSFDKDESITAENYGLCVDNLSVALKRLDTAIENGWDFAIFSHRLFSDESTMTEDEKAVHSTVANWTVLLDRIKEYVDAGKAECVTYSEYYREKYPTDAAELDKIRNYKMKYSSVN